MKKIRILFTFVVYIALGGVLSGNNLALAQDADCGLRVREGPGTVTIACEPAGTLTSPLRIRKSSTTYGIKLVAPTDPNASKIRVKTSSGIKALKKYVAEPASPNKYCQVREQCGGNCPGCGGFTCKAGYHRCGDSCGTHGFCKPPPSPIVLYAQTCCCCK